MPDLKKLAYVDDAGFFIADFEDFLEYNKEAMRSIYGSDINLDADTQDGQLVAHFAQSQYDLALLCAEVFNNFSPATARGDALSREVKINGIARQSSTHSSVDVVITGDAGTTITNGQVRDTSKDSHVWNLPPEVVIPTSGSITVTATCDDAGDIRAGAGTVTRIATPTEGWIRVTNNSEAAPGRDTETDAELRVRQTYSTAQPSQTVLKGILGGVLDVDGVTRAIVYENDTSATDDNGIPSHSIAVVVEGGDAQAIGDVIKLRKTAGTGTYGTTSVTVKDSEEVPMIVNFFRPTVVHIKVKITLEPLTGFTTELYNSIKSQVVDYINSLTFGQTVRISKLYVPANLENDDSDISYDITSIQIAKNSGAFASTNITIGFNEVAHCDIGDVEVVTND